MAQLHDRYMMIIMMMMMIMMILMMMEKMQQIEEVIITYNITREYFESFILTGKSALSSQQT
jgi:hypothetical protein